jgi:predicted nucleic acid-binding protein
MGIALLDSDTVVGFLDADDLQHRSADAAVRATAKAHALVGSVVTVAELLTGAKLGHYDEATVRRFFDQVVSRRIPLDEPTAERAAELRAGQRALKLPDALILATGDLNADVVLTADETLLKTPKLSCRVLSIATQAK